MKKSQKRVVNKIDKMLFDCPPADNLLWVELHSMPPKKVRESTYRLMFQAPIHLDLSPILDTDFDMVESIFDGNLIDDTSTYYGGRKIL